MKKPLKPYQKFEYSGSVSRMQVTYSGFTIYIQELENGKFEVFAEGGSFKCFGTLTKALLFTEKTLESMYQDND